MHNSLSMQRTFPLRERMRERGREREQERMVTLARPLMRWKTPENLFLLHTQQSLNYITLCQHDSDEEIVGCVCVMWETDKPFFHNNIGDCRWLRLLSMWNRDQWAISVYVCVCVCEGGQCCKCFFILHLTWSNGPSSGPVWICREVVKSILMSDICLKCEVVHPDTHSYKHRVPSGKAVGSLWKVYTNV